MCYICHMSTPQIRETINRQRLERRLTQQELGMHAQMTREEINRFLRGKDISLRRLMRICGALGLEIELRPATRRPTADELSDIYKDE